MNNKFKRILYLVLWVIAAILFFVTLGGAIEWAAINQVGRLTPEIAFYGILVILGIFIGLAIGPVAWRKIYVEGIRGKKIRH